MRLPKELLLAIQQEVEKVDRRALQQATAQITERYQAADFSGPALRTEAQRAAYLAVRLPATYAANVRVFAEVHRLAPAAEISSMLDLGAGPGTALFAATEIFPALQQATLIEADESWLNLGKHLAERSSAPDARQSRWLKHDLRSVLSCKAHDLVVLSYVLGELPQSAAEALVRQAWNCARKFLIVIEPGTKRGFAMVNTVRSAVIAGGAEILAPCPHKNACPMNAAGDWCHFAARVERTAQHRQLKGGALGYEDEKFSYVVAGREGFPPAGARIIRHPQKHGGHVQLTLCTSRGSIRIQTVTRSSQQDYKLARKSEWGDTWKE
jgi:ribosomal protein RSM22 (predicted rRNA methylase)